MNTYLNSPAVFTGQRGCVLYAVMKNAAVYRWGRLEEKVSPIFLLDNQYSFARIFRISAHTLSQ